MGFIRKALSIATLGLSGLVFRDDSSTQRTAKPAAKGSSKGGRARKRRATPRARAQADGTAARKPARRSGAKTARASKAGAASRPGEDMANELERLARMRAQGALTDAEFATAKARILGTASEPPAPPRSPAPFQAIEANVAAARHLADLAEREHGEPFVTRGER